MNILLELLLSHPSTLMYPHPEGTLRNQNIDIRLRNFSFHDIPIFLTTIISRIQHLDPINLNNEHSCSHNMPSHIWSEFNPLLLCLYSELDWIDSLKTVQYLLGVEECFILLHLSSISDQVMIDILCRFGHEYLLLEIGIMGKKERQSTTMI